ncbi:Transcription factor WhiB [Gordonia malaquae]|uniref:4Fe-4S Wbl-type domain-containing protein n=1 Tax=Gordonia malaquae NBRC 108250 TaxID=1223542 RepID=M3TJJ3_GORML|nr:WhiB family transcriptional regulator [Gordonia malaquae]GAC81671.1 hypothetical protein GM1_041_00420 [Gordonia malaquae NBRC 108250]SEE26531.1 Transcription factor WhiB [Gordonia malaquae]
MSTKQGPALRGSNMTVQPHPVLSPISGMAWVDHGACIPPRGGKDWTPEQWAAHDLMWHPEKGSSSAAYAAKAVCLSCPVRRECAAAGVRHNMGGVVAGVAVDTKASSTSGGSRARALRALAKVAGLPDSEASHPRGLVGEVQRMAGRGVAPPVIAAHLGCRIETVNRHIKAMAVTA